jgi:diaminohydroxyphosphoribosylaminopyrimidine deaminase / 5-amino-6-(5-phosphoribosylamino)uracil reductase
MKRSRRAASKGRRKTSATAAQAASRRRPRAGHPFVLDEMKGAAKIQSDTIVASSGSPQGVASRALNANDTASGSRSEAQDTVMGGRASALDIAMGWRREAADAADADAVFMRRALELATQYRGRTSPNPIVGCVIVGANGEVIAEGAHRGAGQPHGEADALAKLAAKGSAKGATMYVNLEPCTHQGRTPPCTPAVIASGVARVVVGSVDPVPGHGGGIEALRKADIRVDRALVDECDAANRPFFTWAREQRPAFTLKAAVTLDGKIATVAGQSRWITGEAARADGRTLRDTHDAILVGIGTVIADDPELTARLPGARDPIRIILDSTLRIETSARVFRSGGPRTIIVTTDRAPRAKEQKLVKMGVEVWRLAPTIVTTKTSKSSKASAKAKSGGGAGRVAASGGRVPLDVLGKRLADEGITSVVVEGGGEVHAAFLAADLADELCVYVAPKIVGGPAPSWVGGAGVGDIELAHQFSFVDAVAIDGDLRIRAVRRRPPER